MTTTACLRPFGFRTTARRLACGAGLLLCAPLAAVAAPEAGTAADTAILASAVDELPQPPLRLAGASGAAALGGSSATAARRFGLNLKLPTLSIVEVPADRWLPGSAPPKTRHALSISAETPQRMLRSFGLEATDCATRIRMPSRFKTDLDGSRSFSFGAHLNLACRF